jgi:transposase
LLVNQTGLPWSLTLAAASRGEVLACRPLLKSIPKRKNICLTGDRAYDVPWFRKWLIQQGIEPCIRYKRIWHPGLNQMIPPPSIENPLTYRQRYLVERTFAWFEKFKRLNLRYERLAHLFKSFWQLGAACIIWQTLSG